MRRYVVALALASAPLGCEALAGMESFQLSTRSTDAGRSSDAETSAIEPERVDGGDAGPPPFCTTDPGLVHVHGALGSDQTGDGSCDKPFKSITRGLAALEQSATLTGVRVGGTPDAPVVYSVATTGETFPIDLRKIAWSLRGQTRDGVVIRGNGQCGYRPCAVYMHGDRAELRSVSIQNDAGMGVDMSGVSMVVSDVNVSGCKGAAFELTAKDATLSNIVSRGNTRGLWTRWYAIKLRDSVIATNTDAAVVMEAGASLISTHNRYDSNARGIVVVGGGWVTLEDDVVTKTSSDALVMGGDPGDAATYGTWITRTTLSENTGNAITTRNGSSMTVRVRGSTMVSNAGAALHVAGSAQSMDLDLGSATAPGNNVLNAAATPNRLAICNQSSAPVRARGNTFRGCPPSNATAACSAGKDIGELQQGTIDYADCR